MPELYQKFVEWKASGVWWIGGAPDWLLLTIAALIPIAVILVVFPLIFAFTTLAERKILGRVQNRYGPNRVGPYGLLQPIADGLKMLCKEDIVPARADKLLHFVAPVAICGPVLLIYAVLPYGKDFVPADLGIGVLFIFAIGSASTLAVFAAGWSGRNKYSLLGAMRAVAQMISYEIPLVLSVITVVMIVGSMQTTEIVNAQASGTFWNVSRWFVWTPWGFVGFLIFTFAAMAEAGRPPFDLPEAESEIIAGYHTEYSGFKWAILQMAEYLATIAMAGVGATIFLGGWTGPGTNIPYLGSVLSILYFLAKMMMIVLLLIWIRGTWPRIRVDQLMGFAWKMLLPLSLFNIFVAGVWYYLHKNDMTCRAWFGSAVLLLAAYLILSRFTEKTTLEKRSYKYAQFA
jgi:NADH-quinone oxidoreductase subunit H